MYLSNYLTLIQPILIPQLLLYCLLKSGHWDISTGTAAKFLLPLLAGWNEVMLDSRLQDAAAYACWHVCN